MTKRYKSTQRMALTWGILSIMIFSFSSVKAEAERISQSTSHPLYYKATSVDECIKERACLWYAFCSYMGFHSGRVVAGMNLGKRKNKYLSRWEGPISFAFADDGWAKTRQKAENDRKTKQAFMDVFESVQPHFPHSIERVIQPNLLIITTEDRAKPFNEFREVIIGVLSMKTYNALVQQRRPSKAYYEMALKTPEGQHIGGLIALEDKGQDTDRYRIPYFLLNMLGFSASTFGKDFNEMHVPNLKDHKGAELDDLHYVLIDVLYHTKLRSGVSVCPWPPRQVRCLGRKCQ